MDISIHAPPRGATSHPVSPLFVVKFQFTPLREGRHGCGDWTGGERISIHAPPRGATLAVIGAYKHSEISIHAPPRGATGIRMAQQAMQKFQFTPLREGRPIATVYLLARSISIHAPPRGATAKAERYALSRGYFNSRPSARGDVHGPET